MKKVIRLTESDLTRLIKRIVKENDEMLKTVTFSPGDTVLIKLRDTSRGIETLNPLTSIIVKITKAEFNEPGNTTYYFRVTNVNGTTKIKSGDMGHIEVWDESQGYSLWIDRLGKTIQDGEHSDLIKK
jgi:hypothetical protein